MINIISPTIQEFNGERFYLCGNYFQHQGKRLHVAVWRHYNGEIPKGYHVHHKDKNRAHNDIDNLELVESSMHHSMHMSEREEYNKKHIEDIRVLASEWHRSEEGRAWHRKHAKEQWEHVEEKEYVCSYCGKTFKTTNRYSDNQNRFCSNNCRASFRRKSGIDNEDRVCPVCGKTFSANKYAKKLYCSYECARKKRYGK